MYAIFNLGNFYMLDGLRLIKSEGIFDSFVYHFSVYSIVVTHNFRV